MEFLINAIEAKRLAHALLFLGNDLEAKEVGVKKLAAHLLCDNPRPKMMSCCECTSCHQVATNQHPNLKWVNEETIDKIREVKREHRMQGFSDGYQISVITQGHLLTKAAANALLKTIEEPGNQQLLILFSPSLLQVLPTIASRCQRVYFKPPQPKEISNENFALCKQIETGDYKARAQLAERLAKNREELPDVLANLQEVLVTQAHQCNSMKALEGLSAAQGLLKSNGNPQLVLEKLLLTDWPLN